jgi:hypothetical protein
VSSAKEAGARKFIVASLALLDFQNLLQFSHLEVNPQLLVLVQDVRQEVELLGKIKSTFY